MIVKYWSDYACPFCYIGETAMKQAIANMKMEHDIKLEMKAFELDPDGSKNYEGPTVELLSKKYGYTLEEAQKKAGFSFNLLDVFEDYNVQVYRAIPKQMLEAIYDSSEGDEIRIRKAPGKNDPSGDFNIYTEKSSQTVNGYEIVFYANGNKCGKAVWNMGPYTCSITSRDRMNVDRAYKTAAKIIQMNTSSHPVAEYER